MTMRTAFFVCASLAAFNLAFALAYDTTLTLWSSGVCGGLAIASFLGWREQRRVVEPEGRIP